MTTAVAIAVVLVVLALTNVWVHAGPRRLQLVTGPLAALLLLFVGRSAGLSWQELGLGQETMLRGAQVAVVAAMAVAVVYAAGVAIPLTRGAFRDTRYRLGLRSALYVSLVAIPLGTVLFEEVAFRGVLWGLLVHDHGRVAFAELRRRSGSLVAPIGLHWATNGLGVLAAARVWAVSRR